MAGSSNKIYVLQTWAQLGAWRVCKKVFELN